MDRIGFWGILHYKYRKEQQTSTGNYFLGPFVGFIGFRVGGFFGGSGDLIGPTLPAGV